MSEEMPKSRFQTETEKRWADSEDQARQDNVALDEAESRPRENAEQMSFEDAERILGKESVLGPKDVEQVFGVKLDRIPAIPFSQEELQRAKELGQQLILQVDSMNHKGEPMSREKTAPLTLEHLKQKFTKAHDDGKVFYEQNWYKNEDVFKKEKPRTGWRLTSKDLIPDSTLKNYAQQTDALIEYLQKRVFRRVKLPKPYEDAIAEWKRERAKIEPLATSSTDTEWKRGSQMLIDLTITKLTRELPVEVMYRLILNDQINKDKLLPETYTCTASRDSDGDLIGVGGFDAGGAGVHRCGPDDRVGDVGVSFSRS